MKKKITALLLSAVLAAATLTGCGAPKTVGTGETPDNWEEFLADMGMGWDLGNTFDASNVSGVMGDVGYETAWLSPKATTKQEQIDALKAQGFKTIRIPVSWHDHVTETKDEEGNPVFTIREDWLNRVQEVVDYCFNDDMYVILNIHHDDYTDENYIYPTKECEATSVAYMTQIWGQLAERFSNYDEHLIFETLNEPRLTLSPNAWNPKASESLQAQMFINEYNQVAIDTIRSTGDKNTFNDTRFIMCPGYDASAESFEKFFLPEDPGPAENRIIVSVHAYVPYNFALATTGSGNSTSVYDASTEAGIDYVFDIIQEHYISKDIPVVIGEWGCIAREDNQEARLDYAKYYVTQSRTYCKDSAGNTVKVPLCIWDNFCFKGSNNEGFGLLDRINMNFPDQAYADMITDTWRSYEN